MRPNNEYRAPRSVNTEYDLRTLPKAKYSSGDCARCERWVGKETGYKVFVNGNTVMMHVQCYVKYVSPIMYKIGAFK